MDSLQFIRDIDKCVALLTKRGYLDIAGGSSAAEHRDNLMRTVQRNLYVSGNLVKLASLHDPQAVVRPFDKEIVYFSFDYRIELWAGRLAIHNMTMMRPDQPALEINISRESDIPYAEVIFQQVSKTPLRSRWSQSARERLPRSDQGKRRPKL